MNTIDNLKQLLAEIGPATEEVMIVQQLEADSWHVLLDENLGIDLDYLEDQEKLVLSVELGSPPPDKLAATYAFLLHYNFIWLQTGCLKMGLDASNGSISMTFEANASALDLNNLQSLLTEFAQKALVWRELITVGFEDDASSSSEYREMMPAAIRV